MRGQVAEYLPVAAGLTLGRNGGAVEQHIGVAVAAVNVPMLELGGGGQHIVGVVSRVGHEMLKHHGKQVFPCKTGRHLGRLRGHGHGVAVVDHHCLYLGAKLGIAFMEQHIANLAHVQRARPALAQQLRHLHCRPVEGRYA